MSQNEPIRWNNVNLQSTDLRGMGAAMESFQSNAKVLTDMGQKYAKDEQSKRTNTLINMNEQIAKGGTEGYDNRLSADNVAARQAILNSGSVNQAMLRASDQGLQDASVAGQGVIDGKGWTDYSKSYRNEFGQDVNNNAILEQGRKFNQSTEAIANLQEVAKTRYATQTQLNSEQELARSAAEQQYQLNETARKAVHAKNNRSIPGHAEYQRISGEDMSQAEVIKLTSGEDRDFTPQQFSSVKAVLESKLGSSVSNNEVFHALGMSSDQKIIFDGTSVDNDRLAAYADQYLAIRENDVLKAQTYSDGVAQSNIDFAADGINKKATYDAFLKNQKKNAFNFNTQGTEFTAGRYGAPAKAAPTGDALVEAAAIAKAKADAAAKAKTQLKGSGNSTGATYSGLAGTGVPGAPVTERPTATGNTGNAGKTDLLYGTARTEEDAAESSDANRPTNMGKGGVYNGDGADLGIPLYLDPNSGITAENDRKYAETAGIPTTEDTAEDNRPPSGVFSPSSDGRTLAPVARPENRWDRMSDAERAEAKAAHKVRTDKVKAAEATEKGRFDEELADNKAVLKSIPKLDPEKEKAYLRKKGVGYLSSPNQQGIHRLAYRMKNGLQLSADKGGFIDNPIDMVGPGHAGELLMDAESIRNMSFSEKDQIIKDWSTGKEVPPQVDADLRKELGRITGETIPNYNELVNKRYQNSLTSGKLPQAKAFSKVMHGVESTGYNATYAGDEYWKNGTKPEDMTITEVGTEQKKVLGLIRANNNRLNKQLSPTDSLKVKSLTAADAPDYRKIEKIYKDAGIKGYTIPSSAVGRYQMISGTLAEAAKRLKLPKGTKFTPEVQDQLAMDIFENNANIKNYLETGKGESYALKSFGNIWEGFKGKNQKKATEFLRSYRKSYKAGNNTVALNNLTDSLGQTV